jgi:signal transduction histidine kinase
MTASNESRWLLSTSPATSGERAVAVAVVAVSFVAFVLTVPYVRVPLARIPAFIPIYQSALFLVDLITAVLLLGQFAWLRSRSMLLLAAGYLFDAAMIVAHTLSFPGLFAPTGLLGSGEQTTAWLYVFWHGGFPLFVLGYAYYRNHPHDVTRGSFHVALYGTIVVIAVLTAGLTTLATAGHDLLPRVMQGGDYSMLVTKGISPAVWILSLFALIAVWRRNTSVLDLWMMVVLTIWLFDIALAAVFGSSRFDLGFYAGRVYGLIAASVVLIALMVEMIRLYGHLSDALRLSEERNLDLINTREAMARAQRKEAIDQTTGGIAHDFNNLFTVICGNLEMIGKAPDNKERVERSARNAMTAAKRGARLTRQLLSFGGQQVGRGARIDPNRLIHDLEPLLHRAAEGMQVMTGLSQVIHPIQVDAPQFEAALVNLIGNAKDSGADRVIIETRNVTMNASQLGSMPDATPGEYVVVTVRDTGPGMPPEVAARAFEPFFSTKKSGRASGLGLSQVYGFMRSVGGHVRLDTQPGRGTSVHMYFPKSPGPEIAGPSGTQGDAAAGEAVILVVEDDPDVRDVAVTAITDLGYKVRQAANGEEALQILQDGATVKLLFSDLAMPGMNGVELVAAARKLRPNLKVLLTSGHPPSILSRQADADGTLEFLIKPYLQEDLAARLRRAVNT